MIAQSDGAMDDRSRSLASLALEVLEDDTAAQKRLERLMENRSIADILAGDIDRDADGGKVLDDWINRAASFLDSVNTGS